MGNIVLLASLLAGSLSCASSGPPEVYYDSNHAIPVGSPLTVQHACAGNATPAKTIGESWSKMSYITWNILRRTRTARQSLLTVHDKHGRLGRQFSLQNASSRRQTKTSGELTMSVDRRTLMLQIAEVGHSDAGVLISSCGVLRDEQSADEELDNEWEFHSFLTTVDAMTCDSSADRAGSITEGQELELTCRVAFGGFYPPTLHWLPSPYLQPSSSEFNSTLTGARLQKLETVDGPNGTRRLLVRTVVRAYSESNGWFRGRTCRLSFADVNLPSALLCAAASYKNCRPATNIPPFTNICRTKPLRVHYVPRDVSILCGSSGGESECFVANAGERILCRAAGYPRPYLTWRLASNNSVMAANWTSSPSRLVFTPHVPGIYLCVATNHVGNASSKVQVINHAYDPGECKNNCTRPAAKKPEKLSNGSSGVTGSVVFGTSILLALLDQV